MSDTSVRAFAVLGAVLALPGCGALPGGGGAPEIPTPPPTLEATLGPVGPSAQLYYDNGAAITDSIRLVVRDQRAYDSIWARAVSQQAAPPAAPPVDFDADMVIVVGAGEMTPDDRIQVDSVGVRPQRDAGGDMQEHFVVIVRTTEGCQRFNLPAYPLQIVRVRAFDGPVNFVERRARAECGGPGGSAAGPGS